MLLCANMCLGLPEDIGKNNHNEKPLRLQAKGTAKLELAASAQPFSFVECFPRRLCSLFLLVNYPG